VDGIAPDKVILWAALASRAEDKEHHRPCRHRRVKDDKELKSCEVLHFMPFDPVHKRNGSHRQRSGWKQFFVAQRRPPGNSQDGNQRRRGFKPAVEKAILDFAGKGFPLAGRGPADEEGKWKFVGIVAPCSIRRVCQAKSHHRKRRPDGRKDQDGLRATKIAIARGNFRNKLGLGSNILAASSLGASRRMLPPEQAKAIEGADGFAQVFPEHKFHIIEVLQKHGHIVGMTGDGSMMRRH